MKSQKLLRRKRRNENNGEKISKEILTDISIKQFLSKIDLLKNTSNFKEKGPYIYCAVKRDLKTLFGGILDSYYCYHAGIFECTKELLIHYGEQDEKGKKKPLTMESLKERQLKDYKVIKFFYSNKKPKDFFNLIDKNEWTSEKFDKLNHNCIHCANEYLIVNNIKPILFVKVEGIAYPYLCNECFKELKRDKMYKNNKDGINKVKAAYEISGGERQNPDLEEYKLRCKKCHNNKIAYWEYDSNWLKKSEEEEDFIIIVSMEWPKEFKEKFEKYEKIGESLNDALLRAKLNNLPKNEYALIRKDLIVNSGENEKNWGYVALASLNENKIIEYGNKKINNGSPILRDIDWEDKYLYHTVRTFNINKNIDELFHSINLSPWTGDRYDYFYYSSYNFINVYLNKYNQELFLIKNSTKFNVPFLHLCNNCYKLIHNPYLYTAQKSVFVPYANKKKDKYWWCWDCGKELATFHFILPNVRYNYVCYSCHDILEKDINIKNTGGMYCGIEGVIGICDDRLLKQKILCEKCNYYYAAYKYEDFNSIFI